MTDFICPSCQTDQGAKQLSGVCKSCGATFKATLMSRLILFGGIFLGFMFGPAVMTPVLMNAGVSPTSFMGIAFGMIGSLTAVFVFAAVGLRHLKHEWETK